jgi:ketosteroid isomerase-like protein
MKNIFISIIAILALSISAGHHEKGEVNKESLVAQAYASFAAGDTEAWAKIHTDDLKFTIFGDLPQSGVFVGTDAVIKNVFEVIPAHWPKFSLTPIDTKVSGDVVFVHNKMTANNLDSETMHMFVIRNGKIAAFTAFEDTDSMRRAMVK